MPIDLILPVDSVHYRKGSGRMISYGYVGTHFDVLDKVLHGFTGNRFKNSLPVLFR
jgi:hypothetical protein